MYLGPTRVPLAAGLRVKMVRQCTIVAAAGRQWQASQLLRLHSRPKCHQLLCVARCTCSTAQTANDSESTAIAQQTACIRTCLMVCKMLEIAPISRRLLRAFTSRGFVPSYSSGRQLQSEWAIIKVSERALLRQALRI